MDTGASWEISKKNIYQLSFRCQNACNLHQFEAIFIQNINSVNVFLYFFNAAWFSVFAKIICCKGVNYSRAGDTNRSKNWEIMRRRRNQKIHFSNMGPPLFHHNNSHYTVLHPPSRTAYSLVVVWWCRGSCARTLAPTTLVVFVFRWDGGSSGRTTAGAPLSLWWPHSAK